MRFSRILHCAEMKCGGVSGDFFLLLTALRQRGMIEGDDREILL